MFLDAVDGRGSSVGSPVKRRDDDVSDAQKAREKIIHSFYECAVVGPKKGDETQAVCRLNFATNCGYRLGDVSTPCKARALVIMFKSTLGDYSQRQFVFDAVRFYSVPKRNELGSVLVI